MAIMANKMNMQAIVGVMGIAGVHLLTVDTWKNESQEAGSVMLLLYCVIVFFVKYWKQTLQ